MSEMPEGLRVSLEYCTDLFDEATASQMLEHYRVLLECVVAEPERRLSELALLTEREFSASGTTPLRPTRSASASQTWWPNRSAVRPMRRPWYSKAIC